MGKSSKIIQKTNTRFLNFFELETVKKTGEAGRYFLASRAKTIEDLEINRGETRADGVAPEREAAAGVAEEPAPAAEAVERLAVVGVDAAAGAEDGGDAAAVRLRGLDHAADVGADLEGQVREERAEPRLDAFADAVRDRAGEAEERA